MHSSNTNYSATVNPLATDITGSYSVSERKDTENFIRNCFADAYGADIHQFMPVLLCLKDEFSSTQAALGLRPALNDTLFLENYLDSPVEKILSVAAQKTVSRSEIIEVGNLAIAEKGNIRALIVAMIAFLSTTEFKWACFTIPPLLINSFARLGLHLIEIGSASIDRLPAGEQTSWGSYYQQKPRVMAGYLPNTYLFLKRYSLQSQAISKLWQKPN